MGNVLEMIKKLASWICDIINSVIDWFIKEIRKSIEKKIQQFLESIIDQIKEASNPKQFAKVAGEIKALEELKKIAEEEKKKLPQEDQSKIERLFKGNPTFF